MSAWQTDGQPHPHDLCGTHLQHSITTRTLFHQRKRTGYGLILDQSKQTNNGWDLLWANNILQIYHLQFEATILALHRSMGLRGDSISLVICPACSAALKKEKPRRYTRRGSSSNICRKFKASFTLPPLRLRGRTSLVTRQQGVAPKVTEH